MPHSISGAECSVVIDGARVVNRDLGGVGFHAFFPIHETDEDHYKEVLTARWRELRPSFARLTHRWLRGRPGERDPAALRRIARACRMMAEVGTQVYLTTWDPKPTTPGAERAAYATAVVDDLEHLIGDLGCGNIRWYCMTNELTLETWGSLREDLDAFADYHRLIRAELDRRGLDVALLATDASPIERWDTIEWAAANMDETTGAYGGHHYINGHHPDDAAFYPWFLQRLSEGVQLADAKGKPFIIGEFGPRQYRGQTHGKRWDACHWWDTPVEPTVGLQVAEAVIAALDAGVYAIGYWTFTDFPDSYSETYANRWGVFQWKDHGNRIRPLYFAIGLLTRSFRRRMKVVQCTPSDPLVRVAAAVDTASGQWAVAAVHRGDQAVPVSFRFTAEAPQRLRKFVYDPAGLPTRTDGRLQDAVGACSVGAGFMRDTLAPRCLAVYC